MKGFKTLVLISVLAIVLGACGGAKDPDEAIKKYVDIMLTKGVEGRAALAAEGAVAKRSKDEDGAKCIEGIFEFSNHQKLNLGAITDVKMQKGHWAERKDYGYCADGSFSYTGDFVFFNYKHSGTGLPGVAHMCVLPPLKTPDGNPGSGPWRIDRFSVTIDTVEAKARGLL